MLLRTRIIAIISIVLMVSIGISTAILINLQKKRMIESKIADVEVLSDIILSGVESAMASGNTTEVQKVISSISRNPEILNLRITTDDGYILKSKKPDEVGLRSKGNALLDKGAELRGSIVMDNTITYFSPIPNKAECFGCHSPEIKSNGIIEIKYDVTRSQQEILATKRLLIVFNILTVLVVSGILGILLTRTISVPVSAFRNVIREVAAGNWNAKVNFTGSDELSGLGESFNTMLGEVKSLYDRSIKKEKEVSRVKVELDHKNILEELNAQLQYKVKEVETANKAVLSLSKEVKNKNVELEKMVDRLKRINEVGNVLSSIIHPEELLKIIVRTSGETLKVVKGHIYVARNRENEMYMSYQSGIGIEMYPEKPLRDDRLFGEYLSEGRHVILNHNRSLPVGIDNRSALGVPLKMKGQIIGGIMLEQKVDGGLFSHDEVELLETIANQAIVAMENAWLYETVKVNYFGTIQSLINALEASDKYTRGHSERVRVMGRELARYVGLDYRELEILEHAAILHDIGKIGIDTSVLNKEDELTNTEFSLIRAHPIIGDEILGPIGTLQGVRMAILQHHERYDGKGYPYGIAGEEITLKARILAVVDTFDAMMTDRSYRKALPMSVAVEELRKGSGTQFDPLVVSAFMEMIKDNENILAEVGYRIG